MTDATPGSRHPLSWDDVQVFLAVVQAGSIAASAKRIGVNHSTVLRRIGSLEDTLSTRLFDRLPTGYTLTAAGHEFAERLGGITDQIEEAHRHLSRRDVEIRGLVRVAAPELLVRTVLMPLFARFSLRYPAVQLQLVLGTQRLNLTRREADVAVRVSNAPPENLVGRRIGRVQSALYASRDYLASLPPGATIADYRWVALDDSLAHLNQAKWMQRHVDPARVAIQVDAVDGMVEAVACGAGAGLLLCPVADLRPELVRLAPPDESMDWSIWILTHPDLRQVARIRALTEFLFDTLDQEGTLR
ncbi:LysR family transcriptional regulator [Xylophilus sp. GOD-11R]|uniref:LysR family transcriptional regulator n=1 Tax=Xylophilus sp. GOD-11R TaxID=3089814 RepID=UPI00298C7D4B|nr:LysR family transcriptional regulator [Xylophilus sp. GOD-11R]WPB57400.1 LysR family transcriptional regulator [Xylophilus sp. GOD-11R]